MTCDPIKGAEHSKYKTIAYLFLEWHLEMLWLCLPRFGDLRWQLTLRKASISLSRISSASPWIKSFLRDYFYSSSSSERCWDPQMNLFSVGFKLNSVLHNNSRSSHLGANVHSMFTAISVDHTKKLRQELWTRCCHLILKCHISMLRAT